MDFMGIGFPELLFILFIALMVFGPAKLPEIARALGQGMRKLRMTTSELTRDLTEELNNDIREVGDEMSGDLRSISDSIKEDMSLIPRGHSERAGDMNETSSDIPTRREDETEM